jgi:D-psicose/D-tagatose/L-ribulose 3-epimerase
MTVHPARRLTISNIAWEPREDDAVAAILRGEGVGGVEIAPTKWREQPLEATEAEVAAYRRAWEDRGLRITSLQALFFGKPELQLFGDAATRTAMADHLRGMIDLAARLGARSLVFGSPRNRVRGSVPLAAATQVASEFLREIGVHAVSRDTVVCVEANPVEYGCDFVTDTPQAVELCRAVDHPGVRVNGDLGGMTMSGEDPAPRQIIRGRPRRWRRSATADGYRSRCGAARQRATRRPCAPPCNSPEQRTAISGDAVRSSGDQRARHPHV